MLSVKDVENFLNSIKVALNNKKITPNDAINKVHAKNDIVVKSLGMYLDNDLYRNGIFNTKQAKKINPSLTTNGYNWFEIYRPWGHTSDLVRKVDTYSALIAINQMLLALELGNYKETEQIYDMEVDGNKYANLADC